MSKTSGWLFCRHKSCGRKIVNIRNIGTPAFRIELGPAVHFKGGVLGTATFQCPTHPHLLVSI